MGIHPKPGQFRFGNSIQRLDIFGHPISVTYRGDSFFKTNLGAIFSILMFMFTLFYSVIQIGDFLHVSNPDVISLEKHINLRETDAKLFSTHQFNFGFEFIYYNGTFNPFEVPENIASLYVKMETEVNYGDGTFDSNTTDIDLIDCRILYPELITENILVAGSDSRMFCLDNEVARI